MCTAAIIAGGEARRLGGRPKGTLAVGSTTIIERQIAVVREITADVVIIANHRDAYTRYGVPVVEDVIPGAGALGGLYTALVTAGGDPVLAIACDMPFLQAAFLEHVLAASQKVDVAIPRTRHGYEPLCAAYARRCADRMRQQIDAGIYSIQDVLPYLRVRAIEPREIAPFDADGLLFFNVNTPDDYARAVANARQS